jgi:ribose 5-phosphate isomerase B
LSSVGRRIVTGEEVRSLPEGSLLDLPPDAIVTDVAREWIEKRKIRVVDRPSPPVRPEPVQLAIGSDHAGYEMKESLAAYLREIGASFFDCGTHSKDAVDYPDFAHQVALAVALGRAKRGIVVDGAGIGSAMVANKVPGVRAAACSDETQARNAREHNDANVLTLGARFVDGQRLHEIVEVFLGASCTEERHARRVKKITAIEDEYCGRR